MIALPPPKPERTDSANFPAKADAFVAWMADQLVPAFNADIAALNTNDTRDTSTSSVLIGTGTKVFTVSAGKSYSAGQWLTISNTPAPTNQMIGNVTSYSGTTLTVTVPTNGVKGSGTFAAWTIALTAAPSDQIAATFLPVSSAASLAASRAALEVSSTTEMNTAIATAAASLGGFRNRVLNGDFAVDQEHSGAVVTVASGGAIKHVIDGWIAYCTGAAVTFQTTTVAGRKRARFTGAAGNTLVGFATRMEASNTADMATKFATIRMLLSSSSITTVNWGLYYANTANNFATVTAIQTGSFTINSTEAAYSAITAAILASGATTGIVLELTVGALLGAQTFTIGDVQLEKGSVTTPVFECLHFMDQFNRCIRYARTADSATGTASSATQAVLQIEHKGMFAVPTAAVIGGALIFYNYLNSTFSQSAANISIVSNTANGGRYMAGNFSGLGAPTQFDLGTTGGKILLTSRL